MEMVKAQQTYMRFHGIQPTINFQRIHKEHTLLRLQSKAGCFVYLHTRVGIDVSAEENGIYDVCFPLRNMERGILGGHRKFDLAAS